MLLSHVFQGYNDVSWHNPEIVTPNLHKLAKNGLILENYYVQHVCTPSRAALMTGYYPIHTGSQVRTYCTFAININKNHHSTIILGGQF